MLKKINYKFISLSIVLTLLLSCSPHRQFKNNWAEETLKALSLREKIAQMMIFSFNAKFNRISKKELNNIFELIETDGLGGVHIWYADISSSLTTMNEMQKKSKVPILFDADLEYGLYQRFSVGTEFPPAMAISATGNPNNAYKIGNIIAKEARSVGLHWNLSPVVDINNNALNPIINTRSFGENSNIVSKFSIPLMQGLQAGGMLATAKHFPGHGDTRTDSHSSLAEIPSDSARLWTTELVPFKKMVDENVDAIMVAHINAPDYQVDSDRPATLSKFWIEDILLKQLGYNGIVITDAMEMGAIVNNYSDGFALIETINAGANVVIQNNNFKNSIDIIEKAVLDGSISISKINNSALKMLKMKEKIGLNHNSLVEIGHIRDILHNEEHLKFANFVASEAITCLRDEKDLLPLGLILTDSIYVIDLYDSRVNRKNSQVTKNLISAGLNIKNFHLDKQSSKKYVTFLLSEIPPNSTILINAFVNPSAGKNEIFLPELHIDLIKNLMYKSDKIILASLGTPYLIQQFKNISTYICAFKGSELMQKALSDALIGRKEIKGKLPISIPGLFELGDGLNIKEQKALKMDKVKYKPGKKIIQVKPQEMDVDLTILNKILKESIDKKAWPGCVLVAAKSGKIFIKKAEGYHTYHKKRKMRESDIFDLASITKPVVTVSAAMKLFDQGLIGLDDPVESYLPKFRSENRNLKNTKSNVTIKHLLTHTSGLPAYKPLYAFALNEESLLDSIYKIDLNFKPGDSTVYSDLGMILLGEIITKVSGVSLDTFIDSVLFKPLGMNNTLFNPNEKKLHRIVPTEIDQKGRLIKGVVHDENARALGGVAGHAGLFSNANDLAKFSQMMLNGGIYGWNRIFKSETVKLFTDNISQNSTIPKSMGWDKPSGKSSGGVYLSDLSYGHTGFTGTSFWIDPKNEVIVILLTNAVHPSRKVKQPNYFDWRQRVHSSVYESLKITNMNSKLNWRRSW